jgi:hypothetical protein
MAKKTVRALQEDLSGKPVVRLGNHAKVSSNNGFSSNNGLPDSAGAEEQLSSFAAKVLAAVPDSFPSEEKALSALISSVLDSLDGDLEQRTEMQLFLETLLETDPELKQELLSAVTINR